MKISKGHNTKDLKIGAVYEKNVFQEYKKDGGVNVLVSTRYISVKY